MAETTKTRGRPQKYSERHIRAFKTVVRQHGLTEGLTILNRDGVTLKGTQEPVSISMPTLRRYVLSDQGGSPVKLKQ